MIHPHTMCTAQALQPSDYYKRETNVPAEITTGILDIIFMNAQNRSPCSKEKEKAKEVRHLCGQQHRERPVLQSDSFKRSASLTRLGHCIEGSTLADWKLIATNFHLRVQMTFSGRTMSQIFDPFPLVVTDWPSDFTISATVCGLRH